ncbi:ATP-dependent DNA helicase [Photobacterium leiognathi]|uniref:ATP-dependent DNA helicase n=1 Tax=Photobacterium leiognathi TaxID=553611 RepID=UPI00298124A0|nr:ATP-dependent RecD-like DNA helicase [Photobacterium leiognathi]
MLNNAVVSDVIFYNTDNGWGVFSLIVNGIYEKQIAGKFPLFIKGNAVKFSEDNQGQVNFIKTVKNKKISLVEPAKKALMESPHLSFKHVESLWDQFGANIFNLIKNEDTRIKYESDTPKKTAIDETLNFVSVALSNHLSNRTDINHVNQNFNISNDIKLNITDLINNPDKLALMGVIPFYVTNVIESTTSNNTKSAIVNTFRLLEDMTGSHVFSKHLIVNTLTNHLICDYNRASQILDESALYCPINNYQGQSIFSKRAEFLIAQAIHNKRNIQPIPLTEKINERFNENQQQGIKNALNNGFSIISGAGGTGKTEVAQEVIKHALASGINKDQILITAATGRACAKLTESTGLESQTFHRALNAKLIGNTTHYDAQYIKEYRLIVIDEGSMAETYILSRIFAASHSECRILLMGDKNQLASVGAGCVLRDLLSIKNTTFLTENFRSNTDVLNKCNHILIEHHKAITENNSFRFIDTPNDDETVTNVKNLIANTSNKQNTQIINPTNKGISGCNNINKIIRPLFNDKANNEKTYSPGDRIVITQNNYELEVYNGDTGTISKTNNTKITIKLNNKTITTDRKNISIKHAYCLSTHKTQGSEYPHVIFIIPHKKINITNIENIYTAISRARVTCTVVGNKQNFLNGLKISESKKRATNLKSALQYFNL